MARQKFKFQQDFPAGSPTTIKENKALEPSQPLLPSLPQEKEIPHPLELKYIPRKKISFHEKNDYLQEEIEQLAESILNYGLIHPMEAYYDEEKDLYILESGERRTRAIDLLLERYLNTDCDRESIEYNFFIKHVKGFANGYPLNIVRPVLTESGELTELEKINSLLRLDEANLQVRSVDPLSRATYLKRRKELLQKRNKLLPQGARVNINQILAEQSSLSERTVMKYTAIAEKLIPELQEEFQKNNVTLNEGSRYAQLTPEEQYGILQLVQNGIKVSKQEAERLKEQLKKREQEKTEQEKALAGLMEEKAEIQKKLDAELQEKESEMARLEELLRKEISTEQEVNQAERDALKRMLKKKEEELSNIRSQTEEESAAAEERIFFLQRKISELENKPAIDLKEQKILKLKVSYEASLKNLEASIHNSCEVFKELSALTPEKTEELKSLFLKAIQTSGF